MIYSYQCKEGQTPLFMIFINNRRSFEVAFCVRPVKSYQNKKVSTYVRPHFVNWMHSMLRRLATLKYELLHWY